MVKKKDGSWRLCIDYRELNAKTKNPDTYSSPRIDDTIDELANARYFSTLDLIQGFHQVELTERSEQKTAFHAPHVSPSHWEYVNVFRFSRRTTNVSTAHGQSYQRTRVSHSVGLHRRHMCTLHAFGFMAKTVRLSQKRCSAWQ